MNKVGSRQRVASSVNELRSSYDQLYQEWLGENRNLGEAQQMLDKMGVGRGLLLDVACGLGYLLDMAEERGTKAFGIDLSGVALGKARAENPSRDVTLGNGERLPYPGGTFDYVTCLGSLEHFMHPDAGVTEIARVLKSSGKAAIMLPNSHHIMAIYNVYKTGGILPELQDFERFSTRLEWQDLLERNGLRVLSVHKFNVGFARLFKRGREGFWYLYNVLYRLFGDRWIPLNLSFSLNYICAKADASKNVAERT
jgi:ubiquinone/menaquinone biosynthesis C-methylase UbiE